MVLFTCQINSFLFLLFTFSELYSSFFGSSQWKIPCYGLQNRKQKPIFVWQAFTISVVAARLWHVKNNTYFAWNTATTHQNLHFMPIRFGTCGCARISSANFIPRISRVGRGQIWDGASACVFRFFFVRWWVIEKIIIYLWLCSNKILHKNFALNLLRIYVCVCVYVFDVCSNARALERTWS